MLIDHPAWLSRRDRGLVVEKARRSVGPDDTMRGRIYQKIQLVRNGPVGERRIGESPDTERRECAGTAQGPVAASKVVGDKVCGHAGNRRRHRYASAPNNSTVGPDLNIGVPAGRLPHAEHASRAANGGFARVLFH